MFSLKNAEKCSVDLSINKCVYLYFCFLLHCFFLFCSIVSSSWSMNSKYVHRKTVSCGCVWLLILHWADVFFLSAVSNCTNSGSSVIKLPPINKQWWAKKETMHVICSCSSHFVCLHFNSPQNTLFFTSKRTFFYSITLLMTIHTFIQSNVIWRD